MKKKLFLGIAALLSLSLAACGTTDTTSTDGEGTNTGGEGTNTGGGNTDPGTGTTEIGYVLYVNDTKTDVPNTVPDGWEAPALFVSELEVDDVVQIKYNGEPDCHFYHHDSETEQNVDDGLTFIVTDAGLYSFTVNVDNQVWVKYGGAVHTFVVTLGDENITLNQNQEPDSGRKASFTSSPIDFVAGTKLSLTVDGEAATFWNEGGNVSEGTSETQYSEVTVAEDASGLHIYAHVNADDSYSVYLETKAVTYYLVGDFTNWANGEEYLSYPLIADSEDPNHYSIKGIDVTNSTNTYGSDVKVMSSKNEWFGKEDDGNLWVANGVYDFDFYVKADAGTSHIVATAAA